MLFASLITQPKIEVVSCTDEFGISRVKDIIVYEYEHNEIHCENNYRIDFAKVNFLNAITGRIENVRGMAGGGMSAAKSLAHYLRLRIEDEAFHDPESLGYRERLYSIRTEDALRFLDKRYYFPIPDNLPGLVPSAVTTEAT